MTDLSTISALVPVAPFSHLRPLPSSTMLRVTAWLYIPYLVLTYTVPLRIIIGIFGTLVLSWRAPWAVYLRTTVWGSAYFRWAIYRLWAKLSGQPLPSPTISTFSLPSQPVNTVRFLFTIYENQRWWMGLDWTHALLPSERPSWCTSRQDPVSPPNNFDLPDPMVVFVPDDKGRRIKRTATWRWEENEWKAIVRKEESSGSSRVEKPLPALGGDNPSLLSKAAVKMKEAGAVSNDLEKSTEDADRHDEDEDLTDLDGWIYGDNKWEGRSGKGGIGKVCSVMNTYGPVSLPQYTRYRRWTRIAVVEEHVEVVADGEIGIQQSSRESEPNTPTRSETQSRSQLSDTGSPLRQRLRTALTKGPS